MEAILSNMAEGLIILNNKCEVEFMNPAAKALYPASSGDCLPDMLYGRL